MIIAPRQSISGSVTSSSAISTTTTTTSSASEASQSGPGGDINDIDTDQVPICVQNCVKFGDISDCIKDQTQLCICESTKYLSSVDTCYSQTCNSTEYAYGQSFSVGVCAFVGINISTILPAPTSTSIDVTTVPETYSKTFINLQAIFSSICSLLLALAIILGFLACRTKYRQDKQSQAGSWTNMQTIQSKTAVNSQKAKSLSKKDDPNGGVTSSSSGGNNSSFDPTATYATSTTNNFGISSNYTSGKNKKKPAVFDPTKTFEDDDDDYENYVDSGVGSRFRNSGFGTSNGRGKRGFTNRDLAVDEVDELSISDIDTKDIIIKKNGESSGSGSGSGSSSTSDLGVDEKKVDYELGGGGIGMGDEPVTPTTTIHGGNRSEVDLNGSTVHLNTLDKGDGPKEGRGRAF